MNDFKAIYKILATLDKHKGDESFDIALISPERLKIGFNEWEQLLIELAENNYIKGIVYTQTLSDSFPHITQPIKPRITLDGMMFLKENGLMAKAKELLHLAGDII